VSDVTAFIVRTTDAPEPDTYERFPEQPFDPRSLLGRVDVLLANGRIENVQ
jgi:hypothetical protein